MRIPLFFAAISCVTTDAAFSDELAGQLRVASDFASVAIEPRPPGPRLIQLPDISFTMRIETRCNAQLQTESVSVSVADSRVSLGATELTEQGIAETTIRVPKNQLGPLTIENFCIAGDAPSEAAPLQFRDALSAQVSLTCAAEGRRSIIYQAVALGVELSCESPDDHPADEL